MPGQWQATRIFHGGTKVGKQGHKPNAVEEKEEKGNILSLANGW